MATIKGTQSGDILTVGSGRIAISGGKGGNTFNFSSTGSHKIMSGKDSDGTGTDVRNLRGFDINIFDNGDKSGCAEFLGAGKNLSRRFENSEIGKVVICFAPGTLVATMSGERAVENLREGDRVLTRDNGIRSLAWAGKRKLSGQELAERPEFSPIHIKAGALGNDVPERDMVVSPNHRMLISSTISDVLFGEREVLVAAKYLTGLVGVTQVAASGVEYLHLMFEQHEIILADGAWTESFQPGAHSLNGIENEQRAEIFGLFPQLETQAGQSNYGAARLSLKKHEAAHLSRHMN